MQTLTSWHRHNYLQTKYFQPCKRQHSRCLLQINRAHSGLPRSSSKWEQYIRKSHSFLFDSHSCALELLTISGCICSLCDKVLNTKKEEWKDEAISFLTMSIIPTNNHWLFLHSISPLKPKSKCKDIVFYLINFFNFPNEYVEYVSLNSWGN